MKAIFNKIKSKENKILSFVFAFLIVFIPLREIIAEGLSSYVKVIPDMMIFLLLIYTLIKKGRKLKISKTEIFLGLFILVAFISTLFINDMGIKVFILECRSMLLYYLLYFIINNCKLKEEDFDSFLKALQIILVVVSTFAIVEKIFDKEVFFPVEWKEGITSRNNFPRVYSFFNNPNTFAFFNFLTFVILSINVNKINNKAYFALVALIFTNIWFSGSRSTMLIFMFYLFMIIVKYYKQILNKKIICKYIGIVITTILIILSVTFANNTVKNMKEENNKGNDTIIEKEPEVLLPDEETPEVLPPDEETPKEEQKYIEVTMLSRLAKIFNGEYFKNSKIDGRAYKIIKGFEVFGDHFVIGSGFGSFGDAASLMNTPEKVYKEYKINSDFYADNEFMKNLVETGIIGFSLFMTVVVLMFIRYKKDYIKALTFVCVCMFGLFTNVFEVQIITFLLTLVLSTVKRRDSLYV